MFTLESGLRKCCDQRQDTAQDETKDPSKSNGSCALPNSEPSRVEDVTDSGTIVALVLLHLDIDHVHAWVAL